MRAVGLSSRPNLLTELHNPTPSDANLGIGMGMLFPHTWFDIDGVAVKRKKKKVKVGSVWCGVVISTGPGNCD